MRARLAWFLGGLALVGAVLYRMLGVRRATPTPRARAALPDPRAEELSPQARRVAICRRRDRDEFESAETPVDQAETVPAELADRRRSVHERGRQVAEEMRRGSKGE